MLAPLQIRRPSQTVPRRRKGRLLPTQLVRRPREECFSAEAELNVLLPALFWEVWNYRSPPPFTAGKCHGARRCTADYGGTLIEGHWGNLLWVVLGIAFLSAVIIGVLG